MTSRVLLLAGIVAAAVLPSLDVNAQNLMEGVRRYEAGDYEGAIKEWLPLAQSGNASALFNLGQVYRLGHGVDVDLAMAEVYYRRAADLGHVEAMSNLATLLYFGADAQDNRGEAITLWQRAAALGDARAQYMLGALYFNGDGVPQNNVQAYAWTLLAIDGGSAEAVESGKIIRKYLSDGDQRQAVALAPTLLDREAIDASHGNAGAAISAGPLPATATPAPQAGSAASTRPPAGNKPLLDLSRPPEALEGSPGQVPPNNAPAAASVTADPEPAAKAANPPSEDSSDVNQREPQAPPQPAVPAGPPAQASVSATDDSVDTTKMWTVQLGAFRDVTTAREERDRLSARYPNLLGTMDILILRADLGPSHGVYHRLRAGAFASRAEADAFCRKLVDRGASCVVAAPDG